MFAFISLTFVPATIALEALCTVSNNCTLKSQPISRKTPRFGEILKSHTHTHTGVAAEPAWVAKFSTAAAGPEQFWINYGSTPDQMVVGWVTSDMEAPSTVQFGTSSGSYTHTAAGNATFYKYSAKYTSGLIHHVTLTGLAPKTVYFYLVAGSTTEYSFTSSPGVGQIYPYTFATFADIGENGDADSTVTHMVAGASTIDSYILNGDISYASGCESTGCTTWDAFQRMMSPLAAIKPIAINIGNHGAYVAVVCVC